MLVSGSSSQIVKLHLPAAAAGSINHVSGRAEKWLKERQTSIEFNIDADLAFARKGVAIAEQFCRTMGLALADVFTNARPSRDLDGLVHLARAHTETINQVCMALNNPSYRYTSKSRAKKGVELLRIFATLNRYYDLRILRQTPQVIAKSSARAARPTTGSKTSLYGNAPLPSPDEAAPPVSGGNASAEVPSERAGGAIEVDPEASFRAMLLSSRPSDAPSDNSLFPKHYGLDLQALRNFCDDVLGAAERRINVSVSIVPARPFQRDVAYRSLPGYDDALSPPGDTPTPVRAGLVLFPAPQWATRTEDAAAFDEHRYATAVRAIKGKLRPHAAPERRSFDYGVLSEVENAVLSGESVFVEGISGSGKSTLVAALSGIGVTIFQLGDRLDTSLRGHFSFRYDQIPQMIKKAARKPGPKLLLIDELFLERSVLPQLGPFSQIIIVGDPRQPGARGAQHLVTFIKDLGGRCFRLPTVWRAHNPICTALVNYIGHGSQYSICPTNLYTETDNSIDYVISDDDPRSVAACMLAYAISKRKQNRSVMIAAQNGELVDHLSDLLSKLAVPTDDIQFRYLEDIQGREADCLVVDVRDVATAVIGVDHALRFFMMMMARAKQTTAFILGKRNVSIDQAQALPIQVFIGIMFRYRVAQLEDQLFVRTGSNFDRLQKLAKLIVIDEETMACRYSRGEQAIYLLVKNRNHHNACMLSSGRSLIEAPDFFDAAADIEPLCEILLNAIACDRILPPGVRG